jgi:hypothetical protein
MKYAVQMTSYGMTYIPIFMKFGTGFASAIFEAVILVLVMQRIYNLRR